MLLIRSWPGRNRWDETHFGKFANEYLHGRFFFDVHPPLAKVGASWPLGISLSPKWASAAFSEQMLIALAGWASGYPGDFEFKEPGQPYPSEQAYYGMRLLCAVCGSLCVPLVFSIAFALTRSRAAGALAALMVRLWVGGRTRE
jgi:dolichyl-phosphate-mannose-protein mannosyltransferase